MGEQDFGLKMGTVKRAAGNASTKLDTNCVIVSIADGINPTTGSPIYKDVTARVLASFAGNEYGSVLIPQDGEQVLIGYLDGKVESEA